MISWFIEFKMKKTKIMKAKTWRAILKAAWFRVGRFIWQYIIPKKFTPKGEKEYDMQARDQRYTIRKASKKGHRNPLQWSGQSKNTALSVAEITSTGKGMRLKLPFPWYFGKRRTSEAPDFKKKIKALSPQDIKNIERVLKKNVESEARKVESQSSSLSIRG